MINKNDFVEIDFTGKVKDGEIFDTNLKEEAKKINLEIEERPLTLCIGQNMILPAIDEFLVGKELGKYTLELSPEKAFGMRDPKMIKTMPIKIFLEKQIMPQAGMVFNFDNLIGKVSAVSGGRVIVDFNNPLANKTIIYDLNVKSKIEDINQKMGILMEFFFRRKLEFTLEDNKIKIKVEPQYKPLIEFFKGRFKEILALDLEVDELAGELKPIASETASENKEDKPESQNSI